MGLLAVDGAGLEHVDAERQVRDPVELEVRLAGGGLAGGERREREGVHAATLPATMRPVSPARSRAPLAFVGLVALAVVACGGGTPTPSAVANPSSTTATPPTASAATASSTAASPTGSQPALDRPDLAAVKVDTQVAIGGLSSPLWVGPVPDGSGRVIVAEQGGTIRIVKDGQLQATPYLDISDRIAAGGERGLLGVAFPPGFGTEHPRLFVHYSDHNGDTTIVSYDAPAGATTIDASTERLILHEAQPYANHNGGWIGFDPTGMLLIALGDGGSGGDPENRASNLGVILGKMLRIDVLGAPAGQPYGIPADNPFVGRSDARPEILHYGLRNPFRDSIDPRDREPLDRRRRAERVGGGRRRPGERPRPRLRLAPVGGPSLLQPAAGLRSNRRDDAGHGVLTRPRLRDHRRRRVSRVGHSRRCAARTCSRTTAPGRCGRSTPGSTPPSRSRSRSSRPIARSARSASTTRARSS